MDAAPPGISTLSLHDALPICSARAWDDGDALAVRELHDLGDLLGGRGEDYGVGRELVPAVKLANRERRSEEHTSELQSQSNLVCRLLLEKKKNKHTHTQQANT